MKTVTGIQGRYPSEVIPETANATRNCQSHNMTRIFISGGTVDETRKLVFQSPSQGES